MKSYYLCITPERRGKTSMLMASLATGIGEQAKVVFRSPPHDENPFAVWGQIYLALDIIPLAVKNHRPFWHLDNGFYMPGRGSRFGYYRMTYRSQSAILLRDPDRARSKHIKMKPWREHGKHVVVALPGLDFGRAMGLNMRDWVQDIEERVREHTDRRILVRPKVSQSSLQEELANAWALVTHSSNVAVDAVMAGIPVFVAPTSPAAPVGRTDLEIEQPVMPEREHWLASLLCQQFLVDEMKSGLAYQWMQIIEQQVDGR